MFPPHILDLARIVIAQAREKNVTIAVAESCTGGLIAAALTEIPGSSHVLERGLVVYSNRAKTELAGVPEDIIAREGAVSEAVAVALAEGVLERSGADLAVSCTGIAGPDGGTEEKPVGLVHLAAAKKDATTLHVECCFGPVGRETVRLKSVETALKLLLQTI